MSKKTYWLGLFAACGLLFMGCSDDTTTKKDSGPATEQGIKKDQGPPTEAGPDQKVTPTQCEAKCTAEEPYLCVSDSSGSCVDCLTDGHCAGNPGALGPKCDTTNNFCICDTDPDCSGSKYGKKCDTSSQMCSCETDADCQGSDKCVGSLFGAKVCQAPCKADADCTSTSAPKCNTTNGQCVACMADTDCAGEANTPYCDQTAGQCAACTTTAHCADSLSGSACVDGACGCAADSDCAGANPWGTKCVTKTSPFGEYKECGCDADGACTGNANGPTCFTKFNKCSCADDANCTKAPFAKCNFPYGNAEYKHCQKPCTTNTDCAKAQELPTCNTTNGKCVGCLADTDCKGATPFCGPTTGTCVACKADTDCKGSTPLCSANGSCVECKANTDCASSVSGGLCGTDGSCGCDADTDCASPVAFGKKCVSGNSGKSCGCAAATDCAGNNNGAKCDTNYGVCSCTAVADCTVGTFTKCGSLYAGAPINTCRTPCTASTDCKPDDGLGVCNTTTALCIGCNTAADCTYNLWEKACDTTSSTCLECTKDADCAANPNAFGPKCDTSNNYCTCAAAADCTTNPNGKVCDSGLQACSCTVDTDCPTGKKCTGNGLGVDVCE